MLRKVISGGQVGSDIAALRAAKTVGYRTGGWMPSGFRARDGVHPEYASIYGLRETSSPNYPERTRKNVANADATIRLAVSFKTPGELCTWAFIRRYRRRFKDIQIKLQPDGSLKFDMTVEKLAKWIVENEFEVINIAGNGLRIIEPAVEEFLTETFRLVKQYQGNAPEERIGSFKPILSNGGNRNVTAGKQR